MIFSFEFCGTAHARCTEIDPGNLSRRPTQGMLGRLRCPATGNQNGVVFSIGSSRPKVMIVNPALLPVLPEPSIFLKAVDRWGIRIPLVEILDFHVTRGDGERCSSYSAQDSKFKVERVNVKPRTLNLK